MPGYSYAPGGRQLDDEIPLIRTRNRLTTITKHCGMPVSVSSRSGTVITNRDKEIPVLEEVA